jgi:transcriptional regulator with XRE-family HTH domain
LEKTDQVRRAFANILIKRRLENRWSQVDLGGFSGLENSYISRLEKGSRTPSIEILMRLAEAFKVSPERLMKEIRIEFEKLTLL